MEKKQLLRHNKSFKALEKRNEGFKGVIRIKQEGVRDNSGWSSSSESDLTMDVIGNVTHSVPEINEKIGQRVSICY